MYADSLQLDHDACGNLTSTIVPCCGDLRELKGGHYHNIVEITENAGKSLLDEYVVSLFTMVFLIVLLKRNVACLSLLMCILTGG